MRQLTEFEIATVAGGFTFENFFGGLGAIGGLTTGFIGGGIICWSLGGLGALINYDNATRFRGFGFQQEVSWSGIILPFVGSAIGTTITTVAGGYIGGALGRWSGRVVDYFAGNTE